MIDLTKEKILITGSGGFLGKYLIEELLLKGISKENILAPRSSERDLRMERDCETAVEGMSVVIHLAALTGGGELHKKKPVEILFDNTVMGLYLMKAAQKAGVKKFITAGSAAEYPADVHIPAKEEALWNGSPESVHAPYAEAKRLLLLQGQSYRSEYSFNVLHLLLTNMYGPYSFPESGPIPRFIRDVIVAKKDRKESIVAWGNGIAARDFLYAKDAAEAIILAAENYDGLGPVNIGSGKETSIKELIELIAKLAGFEGAIEFDPTKSSDETRRVLDVSRAEKLFGFRAQTSLRDGLRKTIQWYNTEHA